CCSNERKQTKARLMSGAKQSWLQFLAAMSLLWASGYATPVTAQSPRGAAQTAGSLSEAPRQQPVAPPSAGAPSPLIPEKSLVKIFERGGPLMWPLLFCSVVMMVFVFERAICLRRGNILPRPFVTRFLLQLEDGQLTQAEALKRCEENSSPIAQVFAAAVRKWGRSSVEVEQAMIDAGERVAATLRRNLRVLNTIHTVGPLLGLLGTVLGIIRCFNKIAASKT